jgi:GntR family transcriptional regulator/MocR family aminotransferase
MPSSRTNVSDWSALIPVLPEAGPRRAALYAALRRSIETGLVAPGAKLPTTRELAARFGVARGAAVAAYETLIAEGFAEARVGAGTFVAAAVPRIAAAPPEMPPPRAVGAPLPGALGLSSFDPRTEAIFRRLLVRHGVATVPAAHVYGDPRGGAGLRRAIASYLATARGVRCTPDRVVVTSGTQHGIDLVTRAVLAPGETIRVEDPCYPMALAAFRGAGLRPVGVPVDGEGLDPVAAEALAPTARAVYVTPSHQFPTGAVLSMQRRLALIAWARRTGGWILEDDYDSEFRHAGAPLAALQGMDDADRVIYLGTFSKALFPGLRVGYLVLPPALVEPVLEVRERTDRFPSILGEAALAALLDEGHFAAHVRRARRRARAGRDALVAALEGRGVAIAAPDTGLHLIVADDRIADDTALAARIVARGVGARALSVMGVDRPARQGLVVGFSGATPEAMTRVGTVIAEAIREGA